MYAKVYFSQGHLSTTTASAQWHFLVDSKK